MALPFFYEVVSPAAFPSPPRFTMLMRRYTEGLKTPMKTPNAIRTMLKLIKSKMKGTQPSEKQTVKFARRLVNSDLTYSVNLFRRYQDSMLFRNGPASHYQYIVVTVYSPISASALQISSLPYSALINLFKINVEEDWDYEDE